MRTTIATATILLFGAGAGAVGALDLRGSDTLEDMTKRMLTLCPGTSGIVYLGGGSTAGEQALTGTGTTAPLNTITQQVAPMSRALGSAVCNTLSTGGASTATAESMYVALDGLAIVANKNSTPNATCQVAFNNTKSFAVTDQNGVSGLDCPGGSCPGGSYTVADWRDLLKIVYAGVHANNNANKDCNSDVRHSLVNTWGNLFQGACAGSPTCTQLKHAWRRSDLSGTTDTFLSLLGLPAASTNPFCNGVGGPFTKSGDSDFLDNDPIRRACEGRGDTGGEQVCGKDAKLGLVLPIFVPETHSGLPAAEVYPTKQCSFGFFEWKDTPSGVKCADGTDPIVGTCLLPYENTPSGPNFACINRRGNPHIFTPSGLDSRVYNLHLRNAAGAFRRDNARRFLVGSYYRIHTTNIIGSATGGCQTGTSTTQIGCLAAANPCSIGFAGREAEQQTNVNSLALRGVLPTVPSIKEIVTSPATAYPFARKLYFNTVKGFENVTGEERTLAECFADSTKAKQAAELVGFVETHDGVTHCEDFNASTCATPNGNNACTGNPAPFPTN